MDETVMQQPPPMKPLVRRVIGLVFALGLAAAIAQAVHSSRTGLSRNVREAVAFELSKDVSALTSGDLAKVPALYLSDYKSSFFRLPASLSGLQRYVPGKTTRITDADLVGLDKLPALQGLALSGTHVTDAGLEHLTKLPTLQWLDLQETPVTDAGEERFKEARKKAGLPECSIGR